MEKERIGMQISLYQSSYRYRGTQHAALARPVKSIMKSSEVEGRREQASDDVAWLPRPSLARACLTSVASAFVGHGPSAVEDWKSRRPYRYRAFPSRC